MKHEVRKYICVLVCGCQLLDASSKLDQVTENGGHSLHGCEKGARARLSRWNNWRPECPTFALHSKLHVLRCMPRLPIVETGTGDMPDKGRAAPPATPTSSSYLLLFLILFCIILPGAFEKDLGTAEVNSLRTTGRAMQLP